MGKTKTDIILDPTNEFEAALIDIVQTFRAKSVGYAGEDDPFFNFVEAARSLGTTPLRQGEALLAKHSAALRKWWQSEPAVARNPTATSFSDDGYLDRAVYSIILLVLYQRTKI